MGTALVPAGPEFMKNTTYSYFCIIVDFRLTVWYNITRWSSRGGRPLENCELGETLQKAVAGS